MIPASSASVSSAAPIVAAAKTRSAQGPRATRAGGRGAGTERAISSCPGNAVAGSVAAMSVCLASERAAASVARVGQLAAGVLDLAPLLAHQRLERVGQRHVLEVGRHGVAALVGPIEELERRRGLRRLVL